MAPLPLILLTFPNDMFNFLSNISGITIITKSFVVVLMIFMFLLQAGYNFYIWRAKELPNKAIQPGRGEKRSVS